MPQATSQAWRLIESGPADMASHMALDRELFEAFLKDPEAPPLLRIYRVSKPEVSVGRSRDRHCEPRETGRSNPVLRLLRPFLRKGRLKDSLLVLTPLSILASGLRQAFGLPRNDWTVRPTGGGLVRHGNDLIYSVMARRDTFPTFHQVRTSYLSFHEAVCAAFQKLGIEARLLRCDEVTRHTGLGECFRDPVATDVLVDGRKAAGGAQWRRGVNFLHQGSVRLMRGISFEALKPALIESVADLFGIVWRPG